MKYSKKYTRKLRGGDSYGEEVAEAAEEPVAEAPDVDAPDVEAPASEEPAPADTEAENMFSTMKNSFTNAFNLGGGKGKNSPKKKPSKKKPSKKKRRTKNKCRTKKNCVKCGCYRGGTAKGLIETAIPPLTLIALNQMANKSKFKKKHLKKSKKAYKKKQKIYKKILKNFKT